MHEPTGLRWAMISFWAQPWCFLSCYCKHSSAWCCASKDNKVKHYFVIGITQVSLMQPTQKTATSEDIDNKAAKKKSKYPFFLIWMPIVRVDFSNLYKKKGDCGTVFLLFSPNPGFCNGQLKEWKAAKPWRRWTKREILVSGSVNCQPSAKI